jgi:NAD(P)-dependent dehydrogenase (short-subunit alcohol dehydrogenase family)
MTKRFENKVVVITGGSDGIGLATAKLFAIEGAHVYITGRRQELLAEAVQEIGHGSVGVQGDVTNDADVARLYEQIGRAHQKVDIVFANAGKYALVPLEEIDDAHFAATFDANVKGMVFTVQKALPLMSAGGRLFSTARSLAVKASLVSPCITPARQRFVRSLAAGPSISRSEASV